MFRDAFISDCKRYRWWLLRKWAGGDQVNFVMLNPSTADAFEDDATVRRCVGFAKRWGYGSLIVTNLYGFRATNPTTLRLIDDPVGDHNDRNIDNCATNANMVVCAWGNHAGMTRAKAVVELVKKANNNVVAFGITQKGQPLHPLRLPYSQQLQSYY